MREEKLIPRVRSLSLSRASERARDEEKGTLGSWQYCFKEMVSREGVLGNKEFFMRNRK